MLYNRKAGSSGSNKQHFTVLRLFVVPECWSLLVRNQKNKATARYGTTAILEYGNINCCRFSPLTRVYCCAEACFCCAVFQTFFFVCVCVWVCVPSRVGITFPCVLRIVIDANGVFIYFYSLGSPNDTPLQKIKNQKSK